MATVTMDINELDKLRTDLSEAAKKKEELELELTAVITDKRVIVRRRAATKNDFTYSFDIDKYMRIRTNSCSRYSMDQDEAIRASLELYPITYYSDKSSNIELENFDDVKQELRQVIELQYQKELADARADKKYANDRLLDKERDYIEDQKKRQKAVDEMKEKFEEDLAACEKKYRELEAGKKELTEIEELKEKLEELSEKLILERKKSWWTKLITSNTKDL